IVRIISNLVRKLGAPVGFWLGTRFLIYFDDPNDAEIIINSPNSMDKGGVYKYVQEMIGGPGLFTSGGDYWKMHRRLLNPTVQNTKILNSFYPTMNKCLRILVENLQDKDPNKTINIYDLIEVCTFDMFAKNTFGVDLNIQTNDENMYVFQMVNTALSLVRRKVFEPWCQQEISFKLTKYYKMWEDSTNGMRAFIQKVLRQRIEELNKTGESEKSDEYEKRLRIFIDEIIQLSKEQKCFSEDEMISESLTMLLAGYETSAVTIANVVMMLAMNPEYQERVFEEIQEICPDKYAPVTGEDLNQLIYTECFIKETMRLIPTVPFTGRQAKADFYVGKTYVPAGCELVVSLFEIQRNKKIWGEDAEVFNPDHFLPERIENQHAYAFVPFSAGARNCVGKKYAQNVVRLFVVWLVRNFKFTTDLKYEDLTFRWMIVMKLGNGYPVKVQTR
ncbi:putative cytochrome P450, partial [Pseudolycoriella hygida]